MKMIYLLTVIIKVLGVYLFTYVLQQIISLFGAIENIRIQSSSINITYYIFGAVGLILVYLFLSISCVFFSEKVSTFLLPKTDSDKLVIQPSALNRNDIKSISFIILGVYMIANSIPDIVYNILWIKTFIAFEYETTLARQYRFAGAESLMRFLVGLSLCLFAKKMKRAV